MNQTLAVQWVLERENRWNDDKIMLPNVGGTYDRPGTLQRVLSGKSGRSIFVSFSRNEGRSSFFAKQIAVTLAQQGYAAYDSTDNTSVRNCDLFLLLLSDNYAENSELSQEIDMAIDVLKKPLLIVNMSEISTKLPFQLENRFAIEFRNDYQFEHVMSDILNRIRRFFDTGDICSLNDESRYTFTLVNGPPAVPEGYHARPEDEERIFRQILQTCDVPGSGLLQITGCPGVGKSTLVSQLFLARKPRRGNVLVFWLNCFKYVDGSIKTVDKDLLRLAKQVDSSCNLTEISEIVPFFTKDADVFERVLFVLDDISYNLKFLANFLERQGNSAQLSCCVITRDHQQLKPCHDIFIRHTESINLMPQTEIKAMLSSFPAMKTNVTEEILQKLAAYCNGLPLVAQLLYSELNMKDSLLWVKFCGQLLTTQKPNVSNVIQLIHLGLKQMDSQNKCWKDLLFSTLLFEPSTPFLIKDLKLLWGLPENCQECEEILQEFEKHGLIILADIKGAYLVNHLIWESLVQVACKRFALSKDDPLREIRGKSVLNLNPFEVVNRKRYPDFFRGIFSKLTAESLSRICLVVDDNGQNFFQFLYKQRDMTTIKLICNTMTMLGRTDLIKQISTAKSSSCRPDEDDSVLFQFFDEFENSPLFDDTISWFYPFFTLWRSCYDDVLWRQLAKKSSILSLVLSDDATELQRLALPDDSPELREAFFGAARTSSLKILQFLGRKQPNLLTSQDDKTDLTGLEYAARNGDLEIVRYFLENVGKNNVQFFNDTDLLSNCLQLALNNCHIETVRYLISRNLNLISHIQSSGYTALHSAATTGQLEMVRLLVGKYRGDGKQLVATLSNAGETAAQLAGLHGHVKTVDFLNNIVTSSSSPRRRSQ